MKQIHSLLFLAVLSIGLLSSCKQEDPGPESFTMAEILATNPDIPEVDNTAIPSDAWINSTDSSYKAFVGVYDDAKHFIMRSANPSLRFCGVDMPDVFNRIDNNTYKLEVEGFGIFTVNFKKGIFTSLEYQPEAGCEFEYLGGTYAAQTDQLMKR